MIYIFLACTLIIIFVLIAWIVPRYAVFQMTRKDRPPTTIASTCWSGTASSASKNSTIAIKKKFLFAATTD